MTVLRRQHHHRQVLVDEGDGAVLHLAGGVALGVDVGDFLELERALERDRVVGAAPEEEDVAGLVRSAWRPASRPAPGASTCSICAGMWRSASRCGRAWSGRERAAQATELTPSRKSASQLGGEGLGGGDADLRAGLGVERPVAVARGWRSRPRCRCETARDPGASLLDRRQGVGRLAGLGDGEDQVFAVDHAGRGSGTRWRAPPRPGCGPGSRSCTGRRGRRASSCRRRRW